MNKSTEYIEGPKAMEKSEEGMKALFKREEFLGHYDKRSNVESTFSMMKRKFGGYVRSKTDVAMTNEVLCKILCHNLVVLIHEMHELGIDPVFWGQPKVY